MRIAFACDVDLPRSTPAASMGLSTTSVRDLLATVRKPDFAQMDHTADYQCLLLLRDRKTGLRILAHGRTANDPATSPTSFSPWIVALIPIAELAIAAGLAWPRSRRVAGVFAIFMHLVLLMILGPLGLNHQAGVLIWNIQFLGQAVFLFQWIPAAKLATVVSHGNENAWYRTVGNCSVASIAILVMVLPCTERFGLWDHWPSWAL